MFQPLVSSPMKHTLVNENSLIGLLQGQVQIFLVAPSTRLIYPVIYLAFFNSKKKTSIQLVFMSLFSFVMTAPILNEGASARDSHSAQPTDRMAAVSKMFTGMKYKDADFEAKCGLINFHQLNEKELSGLIVSIARVLEAADHSQEVKEHTAVTAREDFLKTYFSELQSDEIREIEKNYLTFEEARKNSDYGPLHYNNLKACLLKYSAQLLTGGFDLKARGLTTAIQTNDVKYFNHIFPGEGLDKFIESHTMPDSVSILSCLELAISNSFTAEKTELPSTKFSLTHALIHKTHLIVVDLLNNDLTRQLSYDHLMKTYYLLEILTGGNKAKDKKLEAYQLIAPVILENFSMRRIYSRVSSFILMYSGCNTIGEIDLKLQTICNHLSNLLSISSDPTVFYIESADKQVVPIAEKIGPSWINVGEITKMNAKRDFMDAKLLVSMNRLNHCFNRILNFFNAEDSEAKNGRFQCIFEKYEKFTVTPLQGLTKIYKCLKEDQKSMLMLKLDQSMFGIVRNNAFAEILKAEPDASKLALIGIDYFKPEDFLVFQTFFCPKHTTAPDMLVSSLYKHLISCKGKSSVSKVKKSVVEAGLKFCSLIRTLKPLTQKEKYAGLKLSQCSLLEKRSEKDESTGQVIDPLMAPFYDVIKEGRKCQIISDTERLEFNRAFLRTPKYYSGTELEELCSKILSDRNECFFAHLDVKSLMFFMKNIPLESRNSFQLGDLRVQQDVKAFILPNKIPRPVFAPDVQSFDSLSEIQINPQGTVSNKLGIDNQRFHNQRITNRRIAGQKLYNIVAFRKLMNIQTFAAQLATIKKEFVTTGSFNAAINLLSAKSYPYLSNNFRYNAPVWDSDNVPEAITVVLGKEDVQIRFESVIVGGKCTTSGKRPEYLEELLEIIAYKETKTGQKCGRFSIINDVRTPLGTNLLASHWKRTFNSMNEGWSGRIINALDIIIFVSSFLFMFVGLIECYHSAIHAYHRLFPGSGTSLGDLNLATRLTSTAGAVGGNGMVKTLLMVIATGIYLGMSPYDESAKKITTLIDTYDNNLCYLPKIPVDIFLPEKIVMGNNELLDIVQNRYFTHYLSRISAFRSDDYLMDTLTQYNWHLAITKLRSKADPSNDYREPLYFQDRDGNTNFREQTKNYVGKVFKYQKSVWATTFNHYVYELLVIGNIRNFKLKNIDGSKTEISMAAAARKALYDEQRLSSVQSAISCNTANAAFLRNVQLVASVFFVAAYVTPSLFSVAAVGVASHGVALPILFICMALFPHDFRGIFEGIYDLGFYVAYIASSSTQCLNRRNSNVLRVMIDDFEQSDRNVGMLEYGLYEGATFDEKDSIVHRNGQDIAVARQSFWDNFQSASKKVATATFQGLVRHANVLVPMFEAQELGIASGVWKTSYIVKILEFPGDVTRFLMDHSNLIDMANEVAQSIATVN